jgi:ribosomal protein S3
MDCYKTFDICFRKVYGRFFHNTDLIAALSFEFLPKEDKLMISLTTKYPGYIIGKNGEPLQKLIAMICDVCGVTAQINLNETNNYFNELN